MGNRYMITFEESEQVKHDSQYKCKYKKNLTN